jgi:hypothetical protein
MSNALQALPGFYKLLFVYLEPISAILPAPMIWFWPGAAWFHHQQIPSSKPFLFSGNLDLRTTTALCQLGNCYMLVGLMVSFVFRAVGNVCSNDTIAQERIIGATLSAMAITDVTHILSSFIYLPPEIRLNVASWNAITHGNITFTLFIFCVRMAWFLGIGRDRFYYGQKRSAISVNKDL